MKKHVLILGAGFAGLELATRLSDSLADELRITLLDQNESFSFGFSKLDVMFGRKTAEDVRLPYRDISKDGVEFRQERVTSIDPESRRVTTDEDSYEADVLAVALGADYDFAATPGFEQGGFEYYSIAGAERLRDALPDFDAGKLVIAILGHPFKCPPAPFEGALLLHDSLVQRGIRQATEITVYGPMAAPVPITGEVSQGILGALGERAIEYMAKQLVVSIDTESRVARLESGETVPYDLFIGIPVHRVPEVVERSGLAVDGWVPVDHANLATRFAGVYALGDVAGAPVAKAGVFAEAAARVVADDIAAGLRGVELERPYEGAGSCYLEFGRGSVAKVEANFLGGPKPTARLVGPSRELAAEKQEFGSTRRERWFG
ncbi:MAG TPA: FAD-dependent oxidoreductase [Solirubrobacterales bacterium]|nr:FAD-dependent oxidoreductase [Solirubrobacterales bacterium]